jgi:hypothetical protein
MLGQIQALCFHQNLDFRKGFFQLDKNTKECLLEDFFSCIIRKDEELVASSILLLRILFDQFLSKRSQFYQGQLRSNFGLDWI